MPQYPSSAASFTESSFFTKKFGGVILLHYVSPLSDVNRTKKKSARSKPLLENNSAAIGKSFYKFLLQIHIHIARSHSLLRIIRNFNFYQCWQSRYSIYKPLVGHVAEVALPVYFMVESILPSDGNIALGLFFRPTDKQHNSFPGLFVRREGNNIDITVIGKGELIFTLFFPKLSLDKV